MFTFEIKFLQWKSNFLIQIKILTFQIEFSCWKSNFHVRNQISTLEIEFSRSNLNSTLQIEFSHWKSNCYIWNWTFTFEIEFSHWNWNFNIRSRIFTLENELNSTNRLPTQSKFKSRLMIEVWPWKLTQEQLCRKCPTLRVRNCFLT